MNRNLIGTAAICFFILSCSAQEEKTERNSTEQAPSSILEDATITLTTEGRKDAVIYADTLINFEDKDSTIAKVVKVDFYDEKGDYRSTLTSNEGLVRQKTQEFQVWGDVVVENDTARLETQSLHYDPNSRLITTDDFVKFRRGHDLLTGYGMVADSRLENVKILKDVKGEFIDVPKTEEELDKIESKPKETKP